MENHGEEAEQINIEDGGAEEKEEIEEEEAKVDEQKPTTATAESWFALLTMLMVDRFYEAQSEERVEWNSSILLDQIHDTLFNRFGISMELLICPEFFQLCTHWKVFPPELNKTQMKSLYQTSVVWLRNKKRRKITVPPGTPASLMHLMIVYQYAKEDMYKNHCGRRLKEQAPEEEENNNNTLLTELKNQFKSMAQIGKRNERDKASSSSTAGLLGIFFSFYLFLILHELQYECKERDLAGEDMKAMSLWRTHLVLMMQWMNKRGGEIYDCIPKPLLSQQLLSLVFEQAMEWQFIQTVSSTLSIMQTQSTSHKNQKQLKGKEDEEDVLSEDHESAQSSSSSDAEVRSDQFGRAGYDSDKDSVYQHRPVNPFAPARRKKIEYEFECIPPRSSRR